MNKKKRLFLISLALLLVAVLYTFLVKYVDVSNIAPDGSKVGFATINSNFKELVGLKMGWYKFTKFRTCTNSNVWLLCFTRFISII